jgi:enolase
MRFSPDETVVVLRLMNTARSSLLRYPESEKTPDLKMTGAQLADFYASLCKDFPIITIEDPFDQDDWASWAKMTADIGGPVQIVGDDLTVTNVTRVKKAIDDKACNALLLKVRGQE